MLPGAGLAGRTEPAAGVADVAGLTIDLTLPDLVETLAAGPLPLAPERIEAVQNLEEILQASDGNFYGTTKTGGTVNADAIRTDADAVALVKAFKDAGKPIGVICHGGWILTEADLIKDVKLNAGRGQMRPMAAGEEI